MEPEIDLVTDIPKEWWRKWEREYINTEVPKEKIAYQLQEATIAKANKAVGSAIIEGLGQKMGEIPARIWFRWQQEHPGCWQNREFVREFFADNPSLCAPGWKPKTNPYRKGVSFAAA